MPVRLTTLGAARAEPPGADADAITRQPLRFVLLTYLALEGPASRDDVLAKFWGESPEKRARAALNQTVYQLRRTLGQDAILVEGSRISAPGVEVDSTEFAGAVEGGRHSEALALYRGHFLEGIGSVGTWDLENWIERKRAELRQLHHAAAAAVAPRMAESTDVREALRFFRRWVALEPLEERPRSELIRLLASSGQRRAALEESDRYARWLQEELELEPSSALLELVAAVRSGKFAALSPDPPAPIAARVPSPAAGHAEDRSPPPDQADLQGIPPTRSGPGERGTRDRDAGSRSTTRLRARLAVPVGVVVVAVAVAVTSVIAGGGGDDGASPAAHTYPLSNVAVLEFDDAAGEGGQGYLGRALSSTVINQLNRARGLNVTSAAGARLFRDSAVSLDSLRRALRIGSLVEGRVDRSRGRIRVDVRMVDAATGETLGSRIIERDSTETFELLDETAQEVAGFLRGAMDAAVRIRRYVAATRSVEAWHLLMAARDLRHTVPGLLRQRRFVEAADVLARSDGMLERASALDPAWAEPHVERAENAMWRARAGLLAPSTFGGAPWATIADTAARHALRLDSASVTARVVHAQALELLARSAGPERLDSLLTEASAALETATRLDPQSAEAWIAWSSLHAEAGRHSEAAVAARHAYEMDPFHTEASALLYRLFQADFELDRDRSAARWCAEGRARFPEQPPFVYCSLALMGWADDVTPEIDRAWALVDSLSSLQTGAQPALRARFRMLIASVIARAGEADSARATAGAARASGGQDPALLWMEAAVHVQLGDRRQAAALLEEFRRAAPDEAGRVFNSRPFLGIGFGRATLP